MEKPKIVFFDVDGTLADLKTHVISEETRSALKALQKNGIKIGLATGRPAIRVPDTGDLIFDCLLTFNGSLCFADGETVYSSPIPKQDVLQIVQNAEQIGRPVSVATRTDLFANGSDADLDEYFSLGGAAVKTDPDFKKRPEEEEVFQIMSGGSLDEYEKLLKNTERAKITAWWPRAVDIIPSSGGKGAGVQSVLDYYGFTPDEAVAFGDGNNDLEMLQAVGTGVAMANASEELKEAADEICLSVEENGVARWLNEHGLTS